MMIPADLSVSLESEILKMLIEANDKELRAFLEAESLAGDLEAEQVSALGSYLEDD